MVGEVGEAEELADELDDAWSRDFVEPADLFADDDEDCGAGADGEPLDDVRPRDFAGAADLFADDDEDCGADAEGSKYASIVVWIFLSL